MNYSHIRALIAPYAKGRLYVGFSGGADSLAMLLAVHRVNIELGAELCAIHFEHGLRGKESLEDANFCRAFCETHNIPFRLIPLDVPQQRARHESVESAARRCRLDAWKTLTAGQADTAILLGHQADDRRENFFLRLARGSNASGLTGLRERAELDGMVILRPLLQVRRTEIEAFLAEQNIVRWCEDRTNQEDHYRRNFIRHRLLPVFLSAMPFADAGLTHALDALECDARYLEELADREFMAFRDDTETRREQWLALPPALLPRVLRRFLRQHLQYDWIPGQAFLARFQELLSAPAQPERRLLPITTRQRFLLRDEVLRFVSDENIPASAIWPWRSRAELTYGSCRFQATILSVMPTSPRREAAYFDAAQLPDTLLVHQPLPGERMIPFGKTSQEKLKKLRCDRGIPADEAPPVLYAPDGTVIWYPHVRHAAFAPVTKQTKEIVELEIKPLFGA